MRHYLQILFYYFIVCCSFFSFSSITAQTVIPITPNAAGSSTPAFGSSLAGLTNDPFAYDPVSPLAPAPELSASGTNHFHGNEPGTNPVILRFNLSSYTTVANEGFYLDVYGRSGQPFRDDNFDVEFRNGSTVVYTITDQAIDNNTLFKRVTVILPPSTTFNNIRIIGYNSSGESSNFFTVMETRLSQDTYACPPTSVVSVSGCYQNGGSSVATISIEVGWEEGSSFSILVTGPAGSVPTTRRIEPTSSVVTPQVVDFEIPADGSSGLTATVEIEGSSCSHMTAAFSAPAACPPTVCGADQTGGTVFNDYNADGIQAIGEYAGFAGVTVTAFDCDGTMVGTATTDAFGKYAFTGLTTGDYPLRVEFSGLPATIGQGTPVGTNGGSTVQFVDTPDCAVDLGVLDPNDYCQDGAKLIVPCYVNGDPIPGTAAGDDPAIVLFDYSATGKVGDAPITYVATAAEVGTVWGEAYNRKTKKLFMAATVKRHAGLGPLGLGGIYVADLSNLAAPTTTTFLDVTTLGVNVGSIASNVARGLDSDPTQVSDDPLGYPVAARIGIGGITISDDNNSLYFVNLFDQSLYKIDLTIYNATGVLPTTATQIDFLNGATCNGGTLRPWAAKFYKGSIYVGVICDAETSQSKSDLRAYVYELNPTTLSSNVIFDFPLTYPKGFPDGNFKEVTGWFPWTDDWSEKANLVSGNYDIIHPEPIFNDIEFDIDGSMVLAFGDRTGIQTGHNNNAPNGETPDLVNTGFAGGDILRAYSNGNTFILENNAKAGPVIGYGADNDQGPGFGEFYNDNFTFFPPSTTNFFHAELVHGGLAINPGSGEVVVVVTDPLDGQGADIVGAAGVRYYDNQNGDYTAGFQVYNALTDGNFAKATGLGDIVLNCESPSYMEIGNYVWEDTDGDGIQDACEPVINGVIIELIKGTTVIATTETADGGEYYFSDKNAIDANLNWIGTGADTTLLANTTYTIRISDAEGNSQQASLDGFFLTGTNANSNNSNNIDNDGSLLGNNAEIIIMTDDIGSVNHTYDFGFVPCIADAGDLSTTPMITNFTICVGEDLEDNANTSVAFTAIYSEADETQADNNYEYVFLLTNTSGEILSFNATGDFDFTTYPAGTYNICGLSYSKFNTPNAVVTYLNLIDNAGDPADDDIAQIQANGSTNTYCLDVDCLDVNDMQVQVIISPSPNQLAVSDPAICAGNNATIVVSNSQVGVSYQLRLNSNDSSVGSAVAGTGSNINFTVSGLIASTNYNVLATNTTTNCMVEMTDLAEVTVNPNPTVSVNSPTICAGQTATITATAAAGNGSFSYAWTVPVGETNPGNMASFSATTAGNYSVIVTDGNTCTATASGTLTVNPNPTATAAATDPTCVSGSSTVNSDGTITLSGFNAGERFAYTTGNTYSGSATFATGSTAIPAGGVIANNLPNPTGSQQYTVRIFNSNECFVDRTVTLNQTNCTAACAINNADLMNIVCHDNSTLGNQTDDYLTFTLQPTGTSLGANYTVSVSSGTITPTTANYGSATTFQLQNGSAGAGNVTVTITDASGAPCTLNVLITDPGSCGGMVDYPDFVPPGFPACPDEPCHVVDNDLSLGTTVSAEPMTTGDANAAGDDDDGVIFPNNLRPGTQIRLQIQVTNNTGNDAYVYSWADWNGDGDFDDSGEQILTATYNNAGVYSVSEPVFIPSAANQTGNIAFRFRVSTDQTFVNQPCGNGTCAPNGEVEDYVIQLECPPVICLPVQTQR